MGFMAASVVESVAIHAAEFPEKLSLVDRDRALTYRDLWEHVYGYALYLRGQGSFAGRFIAIECDQSVRFVICMLAAHLIGAIAVPVERKSSVSCLREIVGETDAALFIGVSTSIADAVSFSHMDDVLSHRMAPRALDCPFPRGEDVAEVLFSTGTTGKPKGVVITNRNNMAIAENIICGVEMKPDTVEVVPMPLSHSHGLRTTYANLVNGSTAVLADGVLALKKLFMLMDDYAVTAMDVSPSMLSIIFKLSKDRLGDYADVLDYVQLGSAPLSEVEKGRLAFLLPKTRLYNFYGSTEAGRSCLYDFATMSGKPNCIGRPAVNATFVVVDENRQPIASSPERPGLLASAGDINMRGYLNEPELTAEVMADGYVFTNDLGYIDDDGLVYMLGRADDVINFGGVKISPEEIEGIISENPIVEDCACVPVPDEISGQVPLLCVRLADGAFYDAKEFKAFLVEALDASKQPQRIELVDEIPRTYNGKVKRKELLEFVIGVQHG